LKHSHRNWKELHNKNGMRISSQSLIDLLAPCYTVSRSGSKGEIYSSSFPSAQQELNLSDLKVSRAKTESSESKKHRDIEVPKATDVSLIAATDGVHASKFVIILFINNLSNSIIICHICYFLAIKKK